MFTLEKRLEKDGIQKLDEHKAAIMQVEYSYNTDQSEHVMKHHPIEEHLDYATIYPNNSLSIKKK